MSSGLICLYSFSSWMENRLTPVQLMKIQEITACLSLKCVWWLWADPQPLQCEGDSLLPAVEVLPLGQRTRRGDSGMLCWLQVSGTGWAAGLWDGIRNVSKGVNAVKPTSSFSSVPSLLLGEAPKVRTIQQGQTIRALEDALLVPLWELHSDPERCCKERLPKASVQVKALRGV